MGMTRCKSDPCVWIFDARTNEIRMKGLKKDQTNGLHIKLAAHVDDFLITTNSKTKCLAWMQVLGKHLTMKYDELTERPRDYMSLTMYYDRSKRLLKLSQKPYVEKLLRMHNLSELKGCPTPIIVDHNFCVASQPEEVDVERRNKYRSMVAALNWVVQFTCPEGTLAISTLSRFFDNPSKDMWNGAVRALRYMKWKIENDIEGLEFNGMPFKNKGVYHEIFGWIKRNQITAYSDASFLPKELADKSKSRGGDVHMCNGMLLLVICHIITNICLSATEAEYRELSQCARRTLFLRIMAEEFGEPQEGPTLIAEDNQGAIAIAENPGMHRSRTKHVAVDVHFIQAEIEANKTIQLVYCQTLKMVADILTKALPYALFAKFASALTGKIFPAKEKVEEINKRKSEEKYTAKKMTKESKKTPKSY